MSVPIYSAYSFAIANGAIDGVSLAVPLALATFGQMRGLINCVEGKTKKGIAQMIGSLAGLCICGDYVKEAITSSLSALGPEKFILRPDCKNILLGCTSITVGSFLLTGLIVFGISLKIFTAESK